MNTQSLNGILAKAATGERIARPTSRRSAITTRAAWTPTPLRLRDSLLKPWLDKIDALSDKRDISERGELERNGIDVFFGFGE
jgi:hypothetical protein